MKQLLLIALTAIALTSAATPQRQQSPQALKDGGGGEPPCIPCQRL
jgi:hypothetical protein